MPAAAVKSDTYAVKASKAISELKNRAGSSLPAISGYIQTNYGAVNKTALSQALKKGVADGSLKRVKNSYKLAPKAKPAVAPKKKTVVKKATTSKPVKKKMPTKKTAAAKPKKTIKKTTTKSGRMSVPTGGSKKSKVTTKKKTVKAAKK